jgi:hypothetical protein
MVPLVGVVHLPQATSNCVPWKEHGTYLLNPMGHNVIDGVFVCPVIKGNHHGTNQSEMHQIWGFVSSHNRHSQSEGQFQLFNNENTIILFQNMMYTDTDILNFRIEVMHELQGPCNFIWKICKSTTRSVDQELLVILITHSCSSNSHHIFVWENCHNTLTYYTTLEHYAITQLEILMVAN